MRPRRGAAAPRSYGSVISAAETALRGARDADDAALVTPYGRHVVVLGTRSKQQPAPPHVVAEALAEPRRAAGRDWLSLLSGEVEPRTAQDETGIVWTSLWPERPEAQVRFTVSGGASGTDLRWTLHDVDDPGPLLTRRLCRRLDEIVNRDLRYGFGA